jgi:hypothetical protein
MATTRTLGKIIVRKSPYGFDDFEKFQEGTGQSATKAGQLVKLSAGQIVIASDNTDDQILGILMEDCGGTAGVYRKVMRLTPLHVLSISSYSAVSAAASATAIGNIGDDAPLITASGQHYLDFDKVDTSPPTANNIFMIIGIDPINEVGDYYARWLVTVKSTNCQSWTA